MGNVRNEHEFSLESLGGRNQLETSIQKEGY
jgi:hypothetical protein